MDNPIFQKTIVLFILVLCAINVFRTKKKKHSEPVIEEADARERHEWRYLRWGDGRYKWQRHYMSLFHSFSFY